VRANPRISGTKNNVFGIQTGVAIAFLVKRQPSKGCLVRYSRRPELEEAEEKLAFLSKARLDAIRYEDVRSERNGEWIQHTKNDFDALMPLIRPKLSGPALRSDVRTIFSLYSYGIISQRDQWVLDIDRDHLLSKVKFYIDTFNRVQKSLPRPLPNNWETCIDYSIKWPQDARKYLERGDVLKLDESCFVSAFYRPFAKRCYYFSKDMNWSLCQIPAIFPLNAINRAISFSDIGRRADFLTLAIDRPADLHFGASVDAYQQVPLYRYASDGTRLDNITDWALKQFRAHYNGDAASPHPEEPAPAGVSKDGGTKLASSG
jgi:predicted helicase